MFPKGQTFALQQTYFTSGLLFSAGTLALTGVLFAVVVLALRAVSYEGIFTEYNLCIFLMLCATFFQSYTQQFARSIERVNVYVFSGVVLTLTIVLTSLVTLPLWGLHGYIYSIIVSYFAAALYSVAAAPGTHLFLPCPVVVAKIERDAALLHPDDAQRYHVVGVQHYEPSHSGALFGDRGHRHLCCGQQVPIAHKHVVHRLHLLMADFRPRRIRKAGLPGVL